MSLTRLAAVLALFSFTSSAVAQDENREVRYKEKTVIDFEEVDVNGELVKPSGMLLLDRKKADFNPLIRLRENFDEEMKQSVDEVK
jgi:hypothetical protein